MNRAARIIRGLILGLWYIIMAAFKIIVCIVYVFTVGLYYASRGVWSYRSYFFFCLYAGYDQIILFFIYFIFLYFPVLFLRLWKSYEIRAPPPIGEAPHPSVVQPPHRPKISKSSILLSILSHILHLFLLHIFHKKSRIIDTICH